MEFKHTNLPIENEYPKLVRDRIPEIIKANEGVDIEQKILTDDQEFLRYLTRKLTEESVELQNTLEEGNTEEELADVYEIIDAIMKLRNKTEVDIRQIQNAKREKRGGFEKRILMIGKKK